MLQIKIVIEVLLPVALEYALVPKLRLPFSVSCLYSYRHLV